MLKKLDSPTSGNRLIDSLRPDDRQLLTGRMERWRGAQGQIIYEPGDDVQYVYFPIAAALASFRVTFLEGDDVETALVGREGALGGVVSKGRLPAFARSVVQFAGDFARLPLSQLEALKAENSR